MQLFDMYADDCVYIPQENIHILLKRYYFMSDFFSICPFFFPETNFKILTHFFNFPKRGFFLPNFHIKLSHIFCYLQDPLI